MASVAIFAIALGYQASIPTVQAANGWLDRANEGGLEEVAANAYGETGEPKPLVEIVASIIKIMLGFLGLIFIVLIIVSGFQWMTAGGNEEQVQKATARIRNAVIGLFIVLASYGLTVFITKQITRATTNNQI